MSHNVKSLPCIPTGISIPDASVAGLYRRLATLALEREIPPEVVDLSGVPYRTIRLSPPLLAGIHDVCEVLDIGFSEAFAGLCRAGLRVHLDQESEMNAASVAAAPQALPFAPKDGKENGPQVRYYRNIDSSLSRGRIVMAEGSTGIGKGLALCQAAVNRALAGQTPVILAAPTVATMSGLFMTLSSMDKYGSSAAGVRIAMLPGAAEFVDDIALKTFIDDEREQGRDISPAILDWVRTGGRGRGDSALSRHLRLNDIEPAWLFSDMNALDENFPAEAFRLNSDSSGIGEASRIVAACRHLAREESDILVMTHAMLAIGHKTGWVAVPPPKVILIDEAHLFEEWVARMWSSQLSFHSLRSTARKSGGAEAPVRRIVKDAATCIRFLGDTFDGESECLTEPQEHNMSVLVDALSGIKDGLLALLRGKKPLRNRSGLEDFSDTIGKMLNTFMSNKPGRVDLRFSPTLHFPSLFHGPNSVRWALEAMWEKSTGGVCFASATLFIQDGDGNQKCDYLRGTLGANPMQLDTPDPVISDEIYSLPVLYTPGQAARSALSRPKPPKEKGTEARAKWETACQRWIERQARLIDEISEGARGGTLVLYSSYAQAEAAGAELQAKYRDRLLISRAKKQSFVTMQKQFIDMSRRGERPILLSTGAAWTGVDFRDDAVSDESAHLDMVLTDLVIACLPIGHNRSSTMNARIDAMGLYPIINAALLTFKQGLGRLIRRDGVKHRRLWVIDGRLWAPWDGMDRFTRAARRLLANYIHRVEF